MSAVPDDFSARVRKLELDSQSNADGLQSHERICAERYKNIHDKLGRMESVHSWVGGGLITGMAGILVKLVFFSS